MKGEAQNNKEADKEAEPNLQSMQLQNLIKQQIDQIESRKYSH